MNRGAHLCLVFFSLFLPVCAHQLPFPATTPLPQPSTDLPRGGRGSLPALVQLSPSFNPEPDAVPNRVALQQMIVRDYAQAIYRKPTEREIEAIAPRSAIVSQYHDFLAGPNTGIFKLVPDHKCEENTKVISATDDCVKYTMPGAGNSYSFRAGTYRTRDLADLNYSDNMLRISGLLTQGMLVRLGDIPVENVSMETGELTYLTSFRPASDFEKAREIDNEIVSGITRDGFLYKRSLPAAENTTYALRVVAYRGKLMRSVKGIPYNEFDFDKRRDEVVVFRVACREPDGSLTIVWKILSSTDAPKLKPPVSSNAEVQRSEASGRKPRN